MAYSTPQQRQLLLPHIAINETSSNPKSLHSGSEIPITGPDVEGHDEVVYGTESKK
jgi:hypothetical protein